MKPTPAKGREIADKIRKSTPRPPTPELDKMKAVHEKSQAIGEFIEEFLAEKGYSIGQPHKHTPACPGWGDDGGGVIVRIPGTTNDCSFHTDEFVWCHTPIQKLLAEFFEIDLNKAEDERRVYFGGASN